jgi:phytoene synthase
MTVEHYENFPVASMLLPARLHQPVAAIYAFARSADDIADEGDATPTERLALLDSFRTELDAIDTGRSPDSPMFRRLAREIRGHALPIQLFRDLLDAFSQDVVKQRYADFDELLDYCRRSANPVGQLMLHLYRAVSEDNLLRSDCICSSLQLINFWQDVAIDWKKPRIYLPQDDLTRFGVSEAQIAAGHIDDNWRALMQFQIDRARDLMHRGAPLGRAIPGRIGLELRIVVAGGLRILEKIEAVDFDIFTRRPVLRALDWPLISCRALFATAASPRRASKTT